jgi:hypothetical protein
MASSQFSFHLMNYAWWQTDDFGFTNHTSLQRVLNSKRGPRCCYPLSIQLHMKNIYSIKSQTLE